MRLLSRTFALCLVGLGVLSGSFLVSWSRDARADAEPVPAAQPTRSAQSANAISGEPNPRPAGPVVETKGFRSALFGSNEDAIRAAIAKDFGLSGDKVVAVENYAEKTRILSVRVPDLLPEGGTADVAYILGYKSKTLIQVSISWSKASDETITPERLFSNANVLRAHFSNEAYQPDSVVSNVPVTGGIVMFRGNDAAGRTTLLILQGTLSPGEDKQQVLAPTALVLFYMEDAKKPDIFKLEPGQF